MGSNGILNGGPAGPESELPARELLQAGRALLANGLDMGTGRLDYVPLQATPAYQTYRELARSLRTFTPGSLESAPDRMAFWINLYSALMIDAVLQYGVVFSVMRDPGIFRRAAYDVGGQRYSADDIEHGILRQNSTHPFLRLRPFVESDLRRKFVVPTLDPRIHFALVCAANSCPPLAFYSGERLDEQLDLAMRSFLSGGGLRVDHESGKLYISKIFKWYLGDFGGEAELRTLLRPWFEDGSAESVPLQIRYMPYDWGLNQVGPAM